MEYAKMFNTNTCGPENTYNRSGPARLADRTENQVYEYTPEIELAINVALATGRPLLVSGPSGTGKSSLAKAVAQRLGWRYYEINVTSRTSAQDFLWTLDTLRRLNDASNTKTHLKNTADYVKPGVLWWAFNRASARKLRKKEPFTPQPDSPDSVVLIDEIDKAEPDVPNNLLLPIGSLRFFVDDLNQEVKASSENPPLLIITTNEERQLPAAFLRRCVVFELQPPTKERLKQIAINHFGPRKDHLYEDLINQFSNKEHKENHLNLNVAEFLDTVWACISLKVEPPNKGEEPSGMWLSIREATQVKSRTTTL